MNARKLYTTAYRFKRTHHEHPDMEYILSRAADMGLIDKPQRLRRVVRAAAESFDNRDLCDTYDGWMDDLRRTVNTRRIFTPIGQALLAMLGERGQHE